MRVVIFCHSLVSDWNHGNAHFLRGVARELLAPRTRAAHFRVEKGDTRRPDLNSMIEVDWHAKGKQKNRSDDVAVRHDRDRTGGILRSEIEQCGHSAMLNVEHQLAALGSGQTARAVEPLHSPNSSSYANVAPVQPATSNVLSASQTTTVRP
jgi:hypothetical protein